MGPRWFRLGGQELQNPTAYWRLCMNRHSALPRGRGRGQLTLAWEPREYGRHRAEHQRRGRDESNGVGDEPETGRFSCRETHVEDRGEERPAEIREEGQPPSADRA